MSKKELHTGMRWNGDNLRNVINFAGGLNRSVAHLSWEEYEKLVADCGLKIFTKTGGEMVNIGDLIAWIDDELKVLRATGNPHREVKEATTEVLNGFIEPEPVFFNWLKKLTTEDPNQKTTYKLTKYGEHVAIHKHDEEGARLHALCYTPAELYDFILETCPLATFNRNTPENNV